MIFIIANVLNSASSDSISFCELVSSGPPVLTYFEMASEDQKPLDKMEFLLVCG